jgi:hypothetical protein
MAPQPPGGWTNLAVPIAAPILRTVCPERLEPVMRGRAPLVTETRIMRPRRGGLHERGDTLIRPSGASAGMTKASRNPVGLPRFKTSVQVWVPRGFPTAAGGRNGPLPQASPVRHIIRAADSLGQYRDDRNFAELSL